MVRKTESEKIKTAKKKRPESTNGSLEQKEIKTVAQNLTEEILRMLNIEAKVEVKAGEDSVEIKIDGEDPGLLIGYRGENLENLQLLIGIMLNKKLGEEPWRPIVVDVGGWRAAREESLRVLVDTEISKLSSERDFVELPPMPPTQRRSVHIFLKEYPGLTSESVGEDPNRHIVIKKS